MSDRPALDLHGATVAAGTARLRRWLADLAAAGAAEAEVITGWGRHTPQDHAPGALRRAVREVLRDERAVGLFFFNDTPTTDIYTLSLHDALPISRS